jgi:hypothetical protein
VFAGNYFSKVMFSGYYFAPVDGSTPPATSDEIRISGMLVNFGTLLGRR